MRIAFAGFNANGEKCLAALLEHGHAPCLVVAPDCEAAAPMGALAEAARIPYARTDDLGAVASLVRQVEAELMTVASFPRLFPPELLELPPRGILNVHTALLPRWRGIHPLNWALIQGDETMGVSVHFMDRGMDSGDIVAQAEVPVGIMDDVNSMREKLTTLGARLLVQAVEDIERGRVHRRPQDHSLATHAPRRRPQDSRLDWAQPGRAVFNFCRALYAPYPNAQSHVRGESVRVERVHVSAVPGTILARCGERDYVVASADGTLFVRLDRAGLAPGDRLEP